MDNHQMAEIERAAQANGEEVQDSLEQKAH